jgi:hypothetical protein
VRKRHRRSLLLAVGTLLALGMALVAQPTEFHERFPRAATVNRAHWVPGTDIPMSGFERSNAIAPGPH